MNAVKEDARAFWDEAACGERLYLDNLDKDGFRKHSEIRYGLEPFIPGFAGFEKSKGRKVLEIGVGLGADHQRFAEAGAVLTGIDLTTRAVEFTRRRFEMFGLKSDLNVGDAENLVFKDDSFDIVYSWGVIHHSPDTQRAVDEIFRVLKPGGTAKVMIYHKHSLVGYMLWLRYGLLAGRPCVSLAEIYSGHLESPGTKAYSQDEARDLFRRFENVSVKVQLSHGDLLSSHAGQRHEGALLNAARLIWPRRLISRLCQGNGLFMMIEAVKPS